MAQSQLGDYQDHSGLQELKLTSHRTAIGLCFANVPAFDFAARCSILDVRASPTFLSARRFDKSFLTTTARNNFIPFGNQLLCLRPNFRIVGSVRVRLRTTFNWDSFSCIGGFLGYPARGRGFLGESGNPSRFGELVGFPDLINLREAGRCK